MFLRLIKWFFCISDTNNAKVSNATCEVKVSDPFSSVLNNWITSVTNGDDEVAKEFVVGLIKLQTQLQQAQAIIAMYIKNQIIPVQVVSSALKLLPNDDVFHNLKLIILNAVDRNDDDLAMQAIMRFDICVSNEEGCDLFWDYAYPKLVYLIENIKNGAVVGKAVDILVSKTVSMNEVRCHCCLEHDVYLMRSAISVLHKAGRVAVAHQITIKFLLRVAKEYSGVSLRESLESFEGFLFKDKMKETLEGILSFYVKEHSSGLYTSGNAEQFAANVSAHYGYRDNYVKFLLGTVWPDPEKSYQVAEEILRVGFEAEAKDAYSVYAGYLSRNLFDSSRNDAGISAIEEYRRVEKTPFKSQALKLVLRTIEELEKKGCFSEACELAKEIGDDEKINFYTKLV